ncbi:MAG: hypothetical protein LBL65_03975 [Campylobacteraceae bacterium]|nr:hypothetical protein [Campylobacteraceae bacterium]
MINDLLKLQEDIYKYECKKWSEYDMYSSRVSFSKIGELYEIVYFGDGYDDNPNDIPQNCDNFAFASLIELLLKNSSKIKSLIFAGPDEGANGTKNWDFTRLINSKVIFENLVHFKVRLTDLGDHNQSVIASGYDENGQIAALASMMPKLEILQVPSAPNEDFFKLKNLNLKKLTIQAGYDTQNFITNLANSDNLKNLLALDYTNIFYDFDIIGTTFEEYKLLFESNFFENCLEKRKVPFHFTLRDDKLTCEQLTKLRQIKNIQFLYINCKGGEYIRA